ncbi:MAG: glycosyltransferase family 4 protein [Candidatus Margulisiibacteriota bacterium]
MSEQIKINVLMTSPSSDMGGAEKTFWFLSSRLKADDRFEVFGAFPRGSLYPKLKLNFKVVQSLFCIEFIPRVRGLFFIVRGPLYLLTLLINALLCIKAILINKVNIVYVNSSIQLSAVLAAVLTRRKLVVFILEDYFYDNPKLRKWLFYLLAKHADILMCQTNTIKNSLLEIKERQVEIIRSGVYDSEAAQEIARHPDKKYFQVGIIGKIYPLKGQATFIKAIGQLIQEGLPVKGYIYGNCRRYSPNYFYFNKLKNYIEKMKLSENIIFVENQSLRSIYEGLDVVVIASQSESSPLVFSEALKFGKPVISTRTGVMADVGKDDENLLFFDFGNERQLAEKIKMLFSDKGLYFRLLKNGRETYQVYFNEDNVARQFVQLMTEVGHAHRD